jgi:hypothetical protein
MAKEIRIPFEEFRSQVQQVIERVIREQQVVVIETEGADVVTLHAGEPQGEPIVASRQKSPDDFRVFLETAGSWSDLDVDRFLSEVYASRDHATRPPVEL